MDKRQRKAFFRRLTCICIAALLIVQSGMYLNTDAVYAEADQDAYIVITKDDEKAEKLKEDHTVLAENGDALTVELTDSQAAQMETDKDIVCVEKDFTIEAEAETGKDMVKPLDENWNLDFRITKMKTFAEAAGYTNSSVLSDFGKLQTK